MLRLFVKLLFIEYKDLDEIVMSDYISANSGIHHRFRISYKGAKVSQLWVSSYNAQTQWEVSGKNPHFGYYHSCLNALY